MGNHSFVTPSKVRTSRPQKSVLVEDPSKNKSTKPQTQRSAPCDSLGYQRISDIARTGSISGSCPVEENEDTSHVEEDSLDEAECLASASASSHTRNSGLNPYPRCEKSSNHLLTSNSQPPAHLPEVRSKPRTDSNVSHNKNAMKPSPSSMAFFAVPDSASNAHTGCLNQNMTVQGFPPALSHSQSTPRLNPQSVLASPFEHPYPRTAERDFSTPIRRTESAYLTTAKPVVSIDKNEYQLELVNPHPVLPHAKEDPIETHDLVVAEMAAQGVVWAPPRNAMDRHSHSGTLSASRTADNGRLAGDTRWYSAGIEEEEVLTHPSERWTSEEKTNAGSNSFISGSVTISDMNNRSRTRMTQYSSQRTIKPSKPSNLSTQPPDVATSSGLTLSTPGTREARSNLSTQPPDVATSSGLTLSTPGTREARSTSGTDVQNRTMANDSTTKTTDTLMQVNDGGQADLKARLDHEIALRKQQDDYIRQLQKYYDNLLTKHALAEMTIDQLRMGSKVRSESEDRTHSYSKPQRTSDLGLIDQSARYQSQPISVLPNLRRQSMTFGASSEQLLASGPQLHYASTPMLLFSAQQQQQQQQQQLGRLPVSRDWSSAQTAKPHVIEDPDCHERTGGIGIRQIDWTFGNEKYASSEHCHTVHEEGEPNYFDSTKVDTPPSSTRTHVQQRSSNPNVPSKSVNPLALAVPQDLTDS
ncbi:hypothetical protein FGIG_03306 [Fasciola gigantica]|uniref:Uncharacterized protein n=1 Tax=Fasciola gigantica TaxID=46835 RepID=A0A504Z8D1_FASGI|nr:hypothetical protein FGIG_03306 [Fasciola gigantica]